MCIRDRDIYEAKHGIYFGTEDDNRLIDILMNAFNDKSYNGEIRIDSISTRKKEIENELVQEAIANAMIRAEAIA